MKIKKYNFMRKKGLKEKILKITDGTFSTITDYLLFNLEIFGEIFFASPADYSMARMQKRIFDKALGLNSKTIKQTIFKMKSHGWIKKDMKLTSEGKERLKNVLPTLLVKRKWDGNWYLVIFDIPETLHRKRDILREKLKGLGFGQLQQSVWISPLNYLNLLEKIVFDLQLGFYVIFSQTNKLGRENSQELAERIWKLKKLNMSYQKFISDWEGTKDKTEKTFLQMRYLQILAKDPQLPKELLSTEWIGERANRLIKNVKIYNLIKKLKNPESTSSFINGRLLIKK